jgi:hypothetical protein
MSTDFVVVDLLRTEIDFRRWESGDGVVEISVGECSRWTAV